MRTDASPLGLGAFLVVYGVIKDFASDTLTAEDESRLGISRHGSSESQQVLEAMAAVACV